MSTVTAPTYVSVLKTALLKGLILARFNKPAPSRQLCLSVCNNFAVFFSHVHWPSLSTQLYKIKFIEFLGCYSSLQSRALTTDLRFSISLSMCLDIILHSFSISSWVHPWSPMDVSVSLLNQWLKPLLCLLKGLCLEAIWPDSLNFILL